MFIAKNAWKTKSTTYSAYTRFENIAPFMLRKSISTFNWAPVSISDRGLIIK